MELLQLWNVIRRRWWLILLPTIVAVILVIPSLPSVIRPPVSYNITLRFTASQSPTEQNAPTFEDLSYIPWLASEYAVNNIASWMRSDSFAHEIVTQLETQGKSGALIDVGAIRGALVADSARSIMSLSITWADPDEIILLAEAAINVLRTSTSTYFPQFGASAPIIVPHDSIVVAPVPPMITVRLAPFARVAIGFLAGLGLAFLVDYLDPTIRDSREIEQIIALPVLVEIPRE
jgi:capsular polysaccharide biosynthesis protein